MSPKASKKTQGDVAVEEDRPDLDEPVRYAVILHNDHYTTMEFVVEILQRFFRKTTEEAAQLMLKVHNEGKAIAGIYPFDIAETKVVQVTDYARSKGYPLKLTMEPIR